MSNYKGGKKGFNRQQTVQQVRRQHVDRELFTLDYLNQTMNYISYDNQSLTNYLDLDVISLERLSNEDVKKTGLHFVQRINGMKQICDQDIFVKDLQEYGDFVNYDLPKSYQKDLLCIQTELKQELQTQIATKRLKKRFPNIGNRMTFNQIHKLNGKIKEQILTSLMNNFQMVPQPLQRNLQRNPLYRQLFNISEVTKNQIIERQITQKMPSDQGIVAKIKGTYRSQKQSQNADKLKSKKIARGPKKHEGLVKENEQYVPNRQIKKSGKPDQLPLIIEKPVLVYPQHLEHQPQHIHKQYNTFSNSISQVLGNEPEKKQIQDSNNLNIDEIAKYMVVQTQRMQIKKEKPSQQPINTNIGEQRVKRKYNKAPKQPGAISNLKKNKAISKLEKEKKPKRQKRQQKQQGESKKKKQRKLLSLQDKKPQFQPPLSGQRQLQPIVSVKPSQKQQVAYVSIAIQTTEVKNQKPNEIKAQKLDHDQPLVNSAVVEDKSRILQSIRLEQWKQDKNIRLEQPVIGQSNVLGQSSSLQSPYNSRRQPPSASRQQNHLQQSSVSISNPFLPENHAQNEQNEKNNQQENHIGQQQDIVDYLLDFRMIEKPQY